MCIGCLWDCVFVGCNVEKEEKRKVTKETVKICHGSESGCVCVVVCVDLVLLAFDVVSHF